MTAGAESKAVTSRHAEFSAIPRLRGAAGIAAPPFTTALNPLDEKRKAPTCLVT